MRGTGAQVQRLGAVDYADEHSREWLVVIGLNRFFGGSSTLEMLGMQAGKRRGLSNSILKSGATGILCALAKIALLTGSGQVLHQVVSAVGDRDLVVNVQS